MASSTNGCGSRNHENCYSEMERFSEINDNEAFDEDLALSQEMEDSQKKISTVHHRFFLTRTKQDTESDNCYIGLSLYPGLPRN